MKQSWLLLIFLIVANALVPSAFSRDYVILVDVSGSMIEPISDSDSRIRIEVVQQALKNYLAGLKSDARLTLMSFNEGVLSQEEFILGSDPDRRAAEAWVDDLDEVSRAKGWTYLWTSLGEALAVASRYAQESAEEPVVVRALTDGEDTEEVTSFEETLGKYPLVDGSSIRGGLVLIGDITLEVEDSSRFRIISDPNIEAPFDPVLQWAPEVAIEGSRISFFDNSEARFDQYRWLVEGKEVSEKKVLHYVFDAPGVYRVELEVEGRNGGFGSALARLEVEPKAKPTARFQIADDGPNGTFRVGEEVRFLDDSQGAIERWEWRTDSGARSSERHPTFTFDSEGERTVTLKVSGPKGSASFSKTLRVAPEKTANIRWRTRSGRSVEDPESIDWGTAPALHVRNQTFRPAGPSRFEIVDAGASEGAQWRFTGPDAALFGLERVSNGGQPKALSPGESLSDGVYQISVDPNAGVGDLAATLILGFGASSVERQFPIRLQVRDLAPGLSPAALIVPLVGGGFLVILWLLFRKPRKRVASSASTRRSRQKSVAAASAASTRRRNVSSRDAPGSRRVELVELSGGDADSGVRGRSQSFDLACGSRIRFCQDPNEPDVQKFDIGITDVWLQMGDERMELRRRVGGPKRRALAPRRPFQVSDGSKTVTLKYYFR